MGPHQGQDLILVIAHTRQKMIRTITSPHHLPHLLSNNQQTSLLDRLLTGSLSNQDQATYYPRQLNSFKNTVLFHPRTSSMILSSTRSFQESSFLKTLNEI